MSIRSDDLASLCSSLEYVEQEANGMGRMVNCTIVIEYDHDMATATYVDHGWEISIKPKPAPRTKKGGTA